MRPEATECNTNDFGIFQKLLSAPWHKTTRDFCTEEDQKPETAHLPPLNFCLPKVKLTKSPYMNLCKVLLVVLLIAQGVSQQFAFCGA